MGTPTPPRTTTLTQRHCVILLHLDRETYQIAKDWNPKIVGKNHELNVVNPVWAVHRALAFGAKNMNGWAVKLSPDHVNMVSFDLPRFKRLRELCKRAESWARRRGDKRLANQFRHRVDALSESAGVTAIDRLANVARRMEVKDR